MCATSDNPQASVKRTQNYYLLMFLLTFAVLIFISIFVVAIAKIEFKRFPPRKKFLFQNGGKNDKTFHFKCKFNEKF